MLTGRQTADVVQMSAPIISAPSMDIAIEDDGTIRVVRPTGEIDMFTAAQVGSCLRGCRDGHQALVLEISQIEFIDSTGVKMLRDTLRREPDRFWLQGFSPAVERILELTGISRMFRWTDADRGSRN